MQDKICKLSRWHLIKQQLNNLEPQQFGQALERTPNRLIIDVRTPDEFRRGAIPGAINLDYLGEDFIDRLESLDRDQTYFVYCRTSRRSIRTCLLMKNSGFRHVYNLDGGWLGWHEFFEEF